ncbi:flavodoxin [Asanoa ishikariensis]|uniref:Menaquinone-dependent protoporphyrinogen oxidase n=1 Tax=Asanoa ishikariensis TaxID=137265 RepID=A0A1H3R8F1_9ACTN|nr:flavodoxin domain-containing protein [Asanoa ishikariensis]GIF64273.1 flavodoxin [Asanoa ishikariensis]SDZ22102.1 menaquinone-dependent protoporphyrinogen oxidase [Asanoa ishikariensis]
MRVLVTAASKHGATVQIAGAIADELRLRGHEAVHLPLGEARVEEFDAVVVGSAVYIGHWLKEATQFVRQNQVALRARRVWLFSSGPVGNLPRPDEPAVDVEKVERMTAAAGHVVFSGRLDHDQLTFGEKAILSALRAPEGDFRDWAAIRSWAGSVADDLTSAAITAR